MRRDTFLGAVGALLGVLLGAVFANMAGFFDPPPIAPSRPEQDADATAQENQRIAWAEARRPEQPWGEPPPHTAQESTGRAVGPPSDPARAVPPLGSEGTGSSSEPSWRPTRETFLTHWAATWVRPAEEMTVAEAMELGFHFEPGVNPERTLASLNWGRVPDQVFAQAWDCSDGAVRRLFRSNDLLSMVSRGRDDLESARTIQNSLARQIAALCPDERVAYYVEVSIAEQAP